MPLLLPVARIIIKCFFSWMIKYWPSKCFLIAFKQIIAVQHSGSQLKRIMYLYLPPILVLDRYWAEWNPMQNTIIVCGYQRHIRKPPVIRIATSDIRMSARHRNFHPPGLSRAFGGTLTYGCQREIRSKFVLCGKVYNALYRTSGISKKTSAKELKLVCETGVAQIICREPGQVYDLGCITKYFTFRHMV